MKILLVGMNHRSAPVDVRERFAVEDPAAVLTKLVRSEEIEEAALISTCNRVELLVTTQQPDAARHRLHRCFSSELCLEPGAGAAIDLDAHLYERRDREATSHVFRVASSIDSMVVGEPQILGQMKDAYRQSIESGACGPTLSRLFQRAFATAKRVKNETRIAHRPVSVARVAVDLTRQIFESLQDKTALMIGAGEMIEMALFALQRDGLGAQRVANRSRDHAEELAFRFGASAHGLDEIDELLEGSDIVLSCIGGNAPLLEKEQVSRVLKRRRGRPIFMIDMGVPRNIDPAINRLDEVYLYDIDDLQEAAAQNEEERQREALNAERIVVEEQERFAGWLVALQAVPTIRHLRARAETVREAEIERYIHRHDFDDAQREGVEQLTRSIVNKLLHPALARLGAQTDREEGLAVLEEARALFGLDELPVGEGDTLLPGEYDPMHADDDDDEEPVGS
jgi:glutamyl-tRNA reductase